MADRNFVYVIRRRDGAHKVGFSANPAKRCRSLRTAENDARLIYTLERPGDACAVEQYAHVHLYAHRIDGEWFRVTAKEALKAIQIAAYQMGTADPEAATKTHLVFTACPRSVIGCNCGSEYCKAFKPQAMKEYEAML